VALAADVELAEIARQTAGYSGDDITNICRDAAMEPMRRHVARLAGDLTQIRELMKREGGEAVTMADFLVAVARVNPSVSSDDISRHEQYQAQYGST
jgi:katanin p60 ATPase-containing subunit A1